MTLTKDKIFQDVAKKGFSRKQSVKLVESLFEIIKNGLERGEDILISGFGKFYVRKKAERMGRNPKTGLEAVVTARRVVRFRCSPILRDKMN